jgi:anti-sigma factor RsiW
MSALTRERIDAEQYVARYARGTLSAEEAAAFEEFCVLHPELVQDVRVDRAMRRGIRAIDPSASSAPPTHAWRRFAMAAALTAVAIAIGWLFLPATSPSTALYVAASRTLPEAVRGQLAGPFAVVRERGAAVQTIAVPASAVGIELEVEPQASAGAKLLLVVLEEHVDDRMERRGQLELAPDAGSNIQGVSLVVDLREVRGSRLRLTLTREDGAADVFELRIEPRR